MGLILNQIIDISKTDHKVRNSVLEIGAGYGELAQFFKNYFKNTRYIIVDIQPTTTICGYFLHKPNRSIVLPS